MDEILSPPPPLPPLPLPHPYRRNHPPVIPSFLATSEHDHFRSPAWNGARAPPATAAAGSYDGIFAAASGNYSSMECRRPSSLFEGTSNGHGGDGGSNGLSAPLANDGTSLVDVDGLGLQFASMHVDDGVGSPSRAGEVTPSGALEQELVLASLLQYYAMLSNPTSASDGGIIPNGCRYDYGQDQSSVLPQYVSNSTSAGGVALNGYSYDHGQGQHSIFQHYISNATSASVGGGARNGYNYNYGQGPSSNFQHYVSNAASSSDGGGARKGPSSIFQHYVSNASSASDGGGARNGYIYNYGPGPSSNFQNYVSNATFTSGGGGGGGGARNGYSYNYGQDPTCNFQHYASNATSGRSCNFQHYAPNAASDGGSCNFQHYAAGGSSIFQHWVKQPAGVDDWFYNAEGAAPSQWQRELQSLGSKRNPRDLEDFGSDNDSLIFQGREINYEGRSRGELPRSVHKRLMSVREKLPFQYDYPDNLEIQNLPNLPYHSPPHKICNRRMHNLATEQESCRTLQLMLEEGRPEGVAKVYNGIIYHVAELIKDPFGNYLIQKLLEHCNEEQKLGIIRELTEYPSQLVQICKNPHGTRAVQKLIENLHTREQISLVASALEPGVLDLIKDTHGNHVIKSFLKLGDEYKKLIFDVLANHCIDIATNSHGCCVLQTCITEFTGAYRSKLLDHICSNGLHLAMDDYGNYVIQFILEKDFPRAKINLMRQFKDHYVGLSKLKFSSHVVEKCLTLFNEEGRDTIIQELISVPQFDHLLQDPFANYVIQKALQCSQGSLRDKLVKAIRPHEACLRSSPFCKQIFYLLKD